MTQLSEEARIAIQNSTASVSALAREFGVNPKTVAKWRGRTYTTDSSATRGARRSDTLSLADENRIIAFRKSTGASLDRCLKEFQDKIPNLTRSSLYRCFQQHGIAVRSRVGSAPALACSDGSLDGSGDQAKRDQIVTIAGKYFLKYGFERTSMSAVASELGGSRNTLWRHFRSKHDLLVAFIASRISRLQDELDGILRTEAPLRFTIFRYIEHLIRYIYSPDGVGIYRLTLNASSTVRTVGENYFEWGFTVHDSSLTSYMEEQTALGHLNACDPKEAAEFLERMCNGGRYHRAILGLPSSSLPSIEDEVERITRVFLSCYAR